MRLHTHTHGHTRTRTHAHTHIRTHAHTRTHTHTRTHATKHLQPFNKQETNISLDGKRVSYVYAPPRFPFPYRPGDGKRVSNASEVWETLRRSPNVGFPRGWQDQRLDLKGPCFFEKQQKVLYCLSAGHFFMP